jgi:hypothetical protein
MLVSELFVYSREKDGGIGKFPAFLFEGVRLVLLDIEEDAREAVPYIVDMGSGLLYIGV